MSLDAESLARAYASCREIVEGAGQLHLLEPYEHVLAVEGLRQRYRPDHIRVLVLAESHVRVDDGRMASLGPAYLYNHHYYTPWWRNLLCPAFGLAAPQGASGRAHALGILQQRGFWALDASVVALSGYRKLQVSDSNRPFDGLLSQLLSASWHKHVLSQFQSCFVKGQRPKLVLLDSLSRQFPQLRSQACAVLKFPCQSNGARYAQSEYPYGTTAFCRVVRVAETS